MRYPRAGEGKFKKSSGSAPAAVLREGKDITIVTYGTSVNDVLAAARELESGGVSVEVIKLNVLNPLDCTAVFASLRKTGILLAVEEAAAAGCVGERILARCAENGIVLRATALLNLGSGILTHGTVSELSAMCGLDAKSIAAKARMLTGIIKESAV